MMPRSRHGNKDVVGRNRYIIQSEITLGWFRTKSVGFRNRDLFFCRGLFSGAILVFGVCIYIYIYHYIYIYICFVYLYIFLIYDDMVI